MGRCIELGRVKRWEKQCILLKKKNAKNNEKKNDFFLQLHFSTMFSQDGSNSVYYYATMVDSINS